ncbi:hypothetical protein CRYUN_Cryun36dG0050900 [Craigia yunnanensis]
MASSTSATQLLSLIKRPPYRKPMIFPLLLQPRNRYLNLSSSAKKFSNTSLFCLSNSNSFSLTKELDNNNNNNNNNNDNNSLILREICQDHVPDHVLRRVEEVGYIVPTDVQREALPVLFSGNDCILHAQITKVARMLAAKPMDPEVEQKSYTVMALLDGGMLRRHKTWLKAEPPSIVVATIGSLSQMLEKQIFKLDSMQILVVDEVDFLFNSSKQVSSLRKLLTSYSSCNNRQTVFASASIPQHRRFVHDCIQQKWTKGDVVHVHVNPIKPMPPCLLHRFVICCRKEKHQLLLLLLQSDLPESGIIFVGEQSEKSKKAGKAPSTTLLIDLLMTSYEGSLEILLLEEDMNFNSRAASLSEVRQGGGYLLVSTDISARGIDLPETTHIYNFDLPKTAIDYLHRAGRTGRKPFSDKKCTVTNIILSEERFVLQRYENELMFNCEELVLQTQC